MTLAEAWKQIKAMKGADSFAPQQVYSILSDLGIFKEDHKIRLPVRFALSYGVWNAYLSGNITDSYSQRLKLSLQNDGFSDIVISEVISSITSYNSGNGSCNSQSIKNDHNEPNSYAPSLGNYDIRFMGINLGESVDSFRHILVSKRFRNIAIKKYSGLVMMYKEQNGDMTDYENILWEEYEGRFAEQDCMSLVLFASPITQKVYRIDVKFRYSNDKEGSYGRRYIYDIYLFFKDLLNEKYGTPYQELSVDLSKTARNNEGRGVTYNDGKTELSLVIENALPNTNYYQTVLRYTRFDLTPLVVSEKSQQILLNEEREKTNRKNLLSEI